MRRRREPALADRARDVRALAARDRGRQADDHDGPRAPMGRAVARSENVDGEHAAPQPLGASAPQSAVTVAVDILDEDHSLRLAMRRLATDRCCARRSATPRARTGAGAFDRSERRGLSSRHRSCPGP